MGISFIVLTIILVIGFRFYESSTEVMYTAEIVCTLDGEEYIYEVTYDDQYRIHTAGGDAWIDDHVQVEQYNDANVLIAQIEDYFALRGGTFKVSKEEPLGE